jgi:G:T-mismatch repair DNA endonuclease (very short patch repair protein)
LGITVKLYGEIYFPEVNDIVIEFERFLVRSANEEYVRLVENLQDECEDSLYIPYKKEYKLSHKERVKSYDFCIYEYKQASEEFNWRILIEIHGDYWHSFDFFNKTKKSFQLTKIQKRNLRNDILKNTIAKNYKIPIIYIWEHELKNDLDLVRNKIKSLIKKFKQNIFITNEDFIDPYDSFPKE